MTWQELSAFAAGQRVGYLVRPGSVRVVTPADIDTLPLDGAARFTIDPRLAALLAAGQAQQLTAQEGAQ